MSPKPKAITLNKSESVLEITWDDDTHCQYPLDHLREACPCVECRGGHQFMGEKFAPDNLLELKPVRSYDVKALHPVGNYALQPVWDDNHQTGIYTWKYLRQLCPQEVD